MTVAEFFRGLFGGKKRFDLDGTHSGVVRDFMSRAVTETSVRELALNAAVNMIANAVSKCEIKTFKDGVAHVGDEYYLWNVKPNANDNGAQFMRKLIYRLCFDGEALVVFIGAAGADRTQALVADSFAVKSDWTLFKNVYTGVTVGEMTFDRAFPADDVLYLRFGSEDAKRLTDLFYSSYKSLISMSLKSFSRSRGERGIFRVGRIPGDTTYEDHVSEMMKSYMKPYFEGENVALPLGEGQDYTRINGTSNRERTDAGDVRKLINDVFDVTALAYNIPPALLRGEMADTSSLMTNFLTFCVGPICDLISTEITAKRYTRDAYLKGGYVRIDTSSVKHVDIFDVAAAVDKLVSSGAASPNEVRQALGLPKIAEGWAEEHYITKNYQRIVDALNAAAEGGDKSAEELLQLIGNTR